MQRHTGNCLRPLYRYDTTKRETLTECFPVLDCLVLTASCVSRRPQRGCLSACRPRVARHSQTAEKSAAAVLSEPTTPVLAPRTLRRTPSSPIVSINGPISLFDQRRSFGEDKLPPPCGKENYFEKLQNYCHPRYRCQGFECKHQGCRIILNTYCKIR